MSPTILITRPGPFDAEFADKLRSRLGCGPRVVLSPLIRIEKVGQLPDLAAVKTLIFTSRNGVAAFAAKTNRRDIPCYCVGDATAQAARDEGMTTTSCDGTSDDLVTLILAEEDLGPCLHVRGKHAAGNVAERLRAGGITTDETVLYQQMSQPLSDEALALLAGSEPVILPLFSPRTAQLLFASCEISTPYDVVAISENVAAELPDGDPRTVQIAEKPTVSAMLDAVERRVAAANALERGNLAQ